MLAGHKVKQSVYFKFTAMFSNKTLVKTNLTEPGRGNAVAATVAKCLVFFITITATMVGNSLIYAAMKQFRGLRTPANIVLCSLATTDLGMVIVMVLHAITDVSGHWISSGTLCDFVATLGLVLAFISILHLCFLSIDRYVAIKSPLRYLLLVTKRRVFIVLGILWLLPSIFLNLPAADYRFRSEVYGCAANTNSTELKLSPYIFIFVACFVAIPFGIMLFTNAAVFRVALSHVKRMSTIERQLYQTSTTSELSSCHEKTSQRPNNNTIMLKREIKSAKTFALVIGVFLVCYTPFFVTGTYRKVVGREGVSDLVMFITTWLAFANSFSNPLVYSLRYSPFKKAFKKLCCVHVLRITGNKKFSMFQGSKTGRMQGRTNNNADVVQATSLALKKEEEIQKNVSNGQEDDKKEQKAIQSQILHKDDSITLKDSSL